MKGSASYIQSECSSRNDHKVLNELLDTLLDPKKRIDEWDTIDWCRWLMAGGKTPDEFGQTVRRYDNASTCGLVWTANFVAYRCRTCGISPCMSLCAECFQRGNHEGHDFNMFRSQAGGACDCGDTSVMKESGFCHKHGPKAQDEKPIAPADLLCVAEAMMPRIILRLIQHLRSHSKPDPDSYKSPLQEADGFLTMLHHLSEMGGAMRCVMTQSLTNPRLYHNLAIDFSQYSGEKYEYLKENFQLYEEAKRNLPNCVSPPEYQRIKSLQIELKHNTFLEELVFWTVKFEFPQKLVCYLLNMLPDAKYKESFTETFVHHYSRISVMLAQSGDSDTLSNRVVHVSVQLFSNQELAFRMTCNFQLLHVMVISMKAMMTQILIQNMLQDAEKSFHYVVNCGHTVMKNHCYWPLVSDLNNVLTHRPVALVFLSDSGLLDMWLSLLCMFQGMNVNQRELSQHVEFEPNTYYAAFSAELEGSATPMWALISHLKSPEQLGLTKQVIAHCLIALEDWFDAIGFSTSDKPNPYQVSFHLPLHRYLSVFLCQAVRYQNARLIDLLPSTEVLQQLMMHPLQAQVAFHEILSNMWVRNGLQIKGQAMTYIQCHFCNSMVDADIVLLQICATHLDPDWFLKTVMQRFHVWEWLSFHPSRTNSFLDAEQVMPMLEGALTLLTMLMSIRTNIGMSEEEVTRQEMVSLLCMSDRTHSQLMDLLPENSGMTSLNRDFESILNKVADYKAPNFEAGGTMLQGMYMPKPEIWKNEYDPIYVLLRAVHRRDYQSSLDRYSQFIRQNGKYGSLESPWPPFRIPSNTHKEFLDPVKFLQSKTMHAIIFTILYRACHDPDIPDQVIALAVYLLEATIHFSSPVYSKKESPSSLLLMHEVPDLNYKEWFPHNCIIDNVVLNIPTIIAADKPEHSIRMVEVMEVDEDEEEVMELTDENATYHVQSPINEEESGENVIQHPQLPSTNIPLALPPSSVSGTLVPIQNNAASSTVVLRSTVPVSTSAHTPITMIASSLPSITNEASNENMAMVPTTIRPHCIKLKRFFGRSNGLNSQGSSDHQAFPDSSLKALPSAGYNKIEVNESILSLLLKLHSKLSRKLDSYVPLSNRTEKLDSNETESRIGDGPFFIGKVLDRITKLNSQIETNIQEIRQKLWPQKEKLEDHSKSPKEMQDKEDRRRRAKERQQKLMAEFASRQKAFMQKTMETESEGSNSKEKEKQETLLNVDKEYECVICGQTTPSEEERPVGMVVLLQATSVLGHMHQEEVMFRNLPCNDEERLHLKKEGSLSLHMEQLIEEFNRHFDNTMWQMSLNIGWEGGVHVQSCGHYLHLDCHKSYMQSLKSQSQQTQRHQNLAVDRGEYSCPLCRQLANSVLPINPQMGEMAAVVRCYPNSLQAVASELSQLLSVIPTPIPSILKSMAGILEDLTNSTYPQFRSVCSAPNPHSLLLFVCSIARTNLEIELLQRGGNFSSVAVKKSCFVPLFHVLALYTKVLMQTPYAQLWSQLTGMSLDGQNSSLAHIEREVPLFLRDVIALLLQIILTLPLNVDKAFYTCVVQILYNLACLQAVAQISFNTTQNQRMGWKLYANDAQGQMKNIGVIFGMAIDYLEHSSLYINDEDLDSSIKSKEWTIEDLNISVQNLCLPFLRIAALLQSHLYNKESLHIQDEQEEFYKLCKYLNLIPSSCIGAEFSPAQCLNWAVDKPEDLIKTWCQDFINFVNKSVIAGRNMLQRPTVWCQPNLLQLPENYDQIFQYYHRRSCTVCHSVPKDPSVCLVCGTIVCLRDNCCRQQSIYEAVSHSIVCGAGTAMFLAVNSSTIIVIRGKRACLWGSVYLDSFGEEDRDLKRGKPLYLSKERYSLLQQQWINHSFDHTNKRWVWHKDNL